MTWYCWVGAALCSFVFFSSCQSSSQTDTTQASTPPVATQLTGQQLAQTYCGSCHLAPDPSLLDKATWKQGVLPRMALRMGQSDQQMNELMQYGNPDELNRLLAANIFPEKPTLHPDDWQKLVAYYMTKAPDKLAGQPVHQSVRPTLPLFTAHQSTKAINGLVTLLTYDSTTHRIWAGDARGNVYALDKRLRKVDSLHTDSPAVDLQTQSDGSTNILTVGVLNPNDQQAGTFLHRATNGNTFKGQINSLQRPVQTTTADLNRDGRADLIICQFGNYLGKLTWHEQMATSSGEVNYREHVLDEVPGARITLVQDVNGDQWPDVIALLTQGDEQIAVYYNQRNGTFRKQTVLRFPPVYGSSYLDLTDIDRDGDPDLIYTNGDNADYSIVLKPYHGVRVFLNQGGFRFTERWFYPLHGASQTVVRDFDRDGDADIATIAHFPDFNQQPYQGFVFFENTGNLTFVPRTFPTANRGRWLRMDAGDVDQDGDDDILLGSFFKPAGARHANLTDLWRKPGAGIVLLENKLR